MFVVLISSTFLCSVTGSETDRHPHISVSPQSPLTIFAMAKNMKGKGKPKQLKKPAGLSANGEINWAYEALRTARNSGTPAQVRTAWEVRYKGPFYVSLI
jgi:hypothetical protein